MANFTITSFTNTPRTLLNNEFGYVAEGAELVVSGADAVTGSGNNNLVVLGNITAFGNFQAYDFDGTSLDLFVGATGSLFSFSTAISAGGSGGMELSNAGSIIADGTAVSMFTLDTASVIIIANTGYINGLTGLSLNSGNSSTQIANSGIIETNGAAVGSSSSNSTTLTNTGVISSSGGVAVNLGSGNDIVTNAGTIAGKVFLNSGNDTFDGRGGTVLGEVRGGLGDDTYIIDDTGIVLVEAVGEGTDEVRSLVNHTLGDNFETLTLLGADHIDGTGNGSANTITGNGGANALFGENGADTLDGGAGDDTVDGGAGSDQVGGGFGDDRVLGRGGNDLVRGSNGEDLLAGGVGIDTLRGGGGNDTLVGGLGRDELHGEAGQDVFVYAFTSDSTTGAGSDTLKDFTVGEDRLNFAALVDGEFTLNLLGGFSGTGPSIRTVETATSTLVYVDADGDATTDMRIIMDGTLGLTEAEFIL